MSMVCRSTYLNTRKKKLLRLPDLFWLLKRTYIPTYIELQEENIHQTNEGLQILISNAGVMMYGHLLDQTPQDWSLMMNVNLISVSYLTQLASKLMLENPKESSNEIIFINSMAGHVVNDNAMTTMYNCTKFALTTLIENWRKEVRSLVLTRYKFSFLSKILTEQM